MRGAGSITFVAGGLLVALAWAAGAVGVPGPYGALFAVLAEPLALLLAVLGWRFRRSRLALAALAVAITNLLIRGPLEAQVADGAGRALAVLALLLPANLAATTLVSDRPLPRAATLVHAAAILAQPWLAAVMLSELSVDSGAGIWPLLLAPQASLLAFLIAGVFAALVFAARRGTFEVAMLWVLVACALALGGQRDAFAATLLLASAQLTLLFALVEESYRLAYHDELTGLPGRRALEEALLALDGDFVIAMVDIDHFKKFNDRYGHEVGDQALRMVAHELGRVGGGGRAYRYGGEEFAVLFPGSQPRQCWTPLEGLRTAVADRTFSIRSARRPRKRPEAPIPPIPAAKRARLTISLGAAGSSAEIAAPQEVLRLADQALYKAKQRGRNRVVIEGARRRPESRDRRRSGG